MRTKQSARLLIALAALVGLLVLAACQPVMPEDGSTSAAADQTMAATPSVTVADQAITDGMVTVAEVVSQGPGWIVIHAQADGKPGPIIGYEAVVDGANQDVMVQVDAAAATDTLYAMLHTDAGTVGTFEFPGGADVPVKDDAGNVITPAFTMLSDQAEAMPSDTPVLQMASSDELGDFLADSGGLTLYLFLKDEPGVSNCYDTCAEKWPPLLSDGNTTVADGVDEALVGTTERTDGTTQLTYNGWPLYYWFEDYQPGQTFGQNVGEVWFVVSPSGEAVE